MILRIKEVCSFVGLSRSSVYSKIKSDDFPKPISLTSHPEKRSAVGWLKSDICNWIQRCQKSGGHHG